MVKNQRTIYPPSLSKVFCRLAGVCYLHHLLSGSGVP